jgi:NAD(P)-dependent dehydrogenase (short-subunit alcohol dehydrogenase family)
VSSFERHGLYTVLSAAAIAIRAAIRDAAKPLEKPEDWDNVIETQSNAVFLLSKLAARSIIGRLAMRIHSSFLVGLSEALRDVLPHPHNFRVIEVSQLDRKFGAARNDVGSARFDLHETHIADLRTQVN